MNGRCLSQNELAQRWQISESTLERWRAEGIGPVFLKLRGQVRYRDTDILAYIGHVGQPLLVRQRRHKVTRQLIRCNRLVVPGVCRSYPKRPPLRAP